jgi:peptidoglycan/LPS O-acetylase OafA/YrhL
MTANSLDSLRLLAALMVLYSHQYVLLGLAEPWFLGLKTFGTAGVSIFFFLSGFLVWTSWARDPNVRRFFLRRSLRIFPALWVVTLASVFLLGPAASALPVGDYFASPSTWRYLQTLVLVSPNTLPGIFLGNPMPSVVNGSLWTLPVEFLCYVSVALVGICMAIVKAPRAMTIVGALLGVVLLASFGGRIIGHRFAPHLEMVALFWWGVFYGYCRQTTPGIPAAVLSAIAFIGFTWFGSHGLKGAGMLVCAATMVHVAMSLPHGAKWSRRLGDLSYGVYIFAFPVQQWGVQWARQQNWSFAASLFLSVTATLLLAYASWHLVEQRALRFKPGGVPA